jgi:hypothetical protein
MGLVFGGGTECGFEFFLKISLGKPNGFGKYF